MMPIEWVAVESLILVALVGATLAWHYMYRDYCIEEF